MIYFLVQDILQVCHTCLFLHLATVDQVILESDLFFDTVNKKQSKDVLWSFLKNIADRFYRKTKE